MQFEEVDPKDYRLLPEYKSWLKEIAEFIKANTGEVLTAAKVARSVSAKPKWDIREAIRTAVDEMENVMVAPGHIEYISFTGIKSSWFGEATDHYRSRGLKSRSGFAR
jgi:hypothetical protein